MKIRFPHLAGLIISLSIMASCSEKQQDFPNPMDAKHKHANKESNLAEYVNNINSGKIKEDTLKGSPEMVAMETVGKTHIHINYSAPGVKKRQIWGGLVSYGQVWVTGAHNATKINISHEIKIDGKTIPAGEYAFFTIPDHYTWKVILNKNANQHLADNYSEKEDVARFDVTPELNTNFVPRLRYTVEKNSETEGAIVVEWEKVKVTLPFTSK